MSLKKKKIVKCLVKKGYENEKSKWLCGDKIYET